MTPPPAATAPAEPARGRIAGQIRRLAGGAVTALLVLVVVGLVALVTANAFGHRSLIVRSGSMGDTIPVGSLVVTAPIPRDDIRVGDVAAVAPDGPDSARLHRVIEVNEVGGDIVVTTQGDANETPDSEQTVLDEEVHVRLHSVPFVGYVLDGAGSHTGLLALGSAGAVLIGWWLLRALWRPAPEPTAGQVAPS